MRYRLLSAVPFALPAVVRETQGRGPYRACVWGDAWPWPGGLSVHGHVSGVMQYGSRLTRSLETGTE